MPVANVLCMNANAYNKYGIDAALIGASRSGLRHLELTAVPGKSDFLRADMTEREADEAKALLARSGVEIVTLASHTNLLDAEGLGVMRKNLRLAERLGVHFVVTSVSYHPTGTLDGDEAQAEANREAEATYVESLQEVSEIAADHGVRLGIETHGFECPSGREVLRLVDLVDRPNVGINYDTGNVVYYSGTAPYEDLEGCLHKVFGVHLKDKIGGSRVWNFPPIGQGELDMQRIMSILRGVSGIPISIEIEFTPEGSSGPEEVHQAFTDSVAHLRALAE